MCFKKQDEVHRFFVKEGEMEVLLFMTSFMEEGTRKRGSLFPLPRIFEIEWNYTKKCPGETFWLFINKKARPLIKSWVFQASADATAAVTNSRRISKHVPLINSISTRLENDNRMTPYLHDLSATSSAYQKVHKLINDDLCSHSNLKLRISQLEKHINYNEFDSWVNQHKILHSCCYVILYLESDVNQLTFNNSHVLLSKTLIQLHLELNLIVSVSTRPERSDIHTGLNVAQRAECIEWQKTMSEQVDLSAVFGDYGTARLGKLAHIDSKLMSISEKFKYFTNNDTWLISKCCLHMRRMKQAPLRELSSNPIFDAIVAEYLFVQDHCTDNNWVSPLSSTEHIDFVRISKENIPSYACHSITNYHSVQPKWNRILNVGYRVCRSVFHCAKRVFSFLLQSLRFIITFMPPTIKIMLVIKQFLDQALSLIKYCNLGNWL